MIHWIKNWFGIVFTGVVDTASFFVIVVVVLVDAVQDLFRFPVNTARASSIRIMQSCRIDGNRNRNESLCRQNRDLLLYQFTVDDGD